MELLIFFIAVNLLLVLWRSRKKIMANIRYLNGLGNERIGLLGYPFGAGSDYESAISSNPGHAKAHFRLGIMCNVSGYYDKGRRELQKAFELAPELKRAESIVEATQYARKYLIDVTQRIKNDAEAWHGMAMLCYVTGDIAEARKAIEKWQESKLEYVIEKYSSGKPILVRGGFDHICITPYPEYASYMYALTTNAAEVARVAINVGDLDFADNLLRSSLEHNLRDAGIWTCYKNLIKKLDRTKKDKCAELFKKTTERDKDNLGAWQCLGEVLADLGRYYELQECNAQIRRLDPMSDTRSLKSPEEVSREREEAERKLEEARRRAREETMNEYYEIAFDEEGCYSMKDMIEACHHLLTGSTEAVARHRLGMLYYECGKYYSAKVELIEAAKLDWSLKEEAIILELLNIIGELKRISPKNFVPKASITEYGVDPKDLDGGQVVDVFRINGLRGISVKFQRKLGDESPMFYRYQILFYENDDVRPSYIVRLEESALDTCCITKTDLKTGLRNNFGAGYEDMAYEEFKYQVIAIMREYKPPITTTDEA